MLTYASVRVTRRGPNLQPDIKERPGLTLDFVARQGVKLGSVNAEVKFEARNITGRKYREFQEQDGNRVYYNRYKIGSTIRSEEQTSELQSLMRISYAVFCLTKKIHKRNVSSQHNTSYIRERI